MVCKWKKTKVLLVRDLHYFPFADHFWPHGLDGIRIDAKMFPLQPVKEK